MKLTKQLKKVILRLLELYLTFVIIHQTICAYVSQVWVRIEAWAHTELAMLLKYIKTPVLSVPLGFLSHLKQSDASTVTGRVLAAIFW